MQIVECDIIIEENFFALNYLLQYLQNKTVALQKSTYFSDNRDNHLILKTKNYRRLSLIILAFTSIFTIL